MNLQKTIMAKQFEIEALVSAGKKHMAEREEALKKLEAAETEARLLRARMAVLTNLVNERSDERDTAWGELKEIREAIGANPEESTADEVRRVIAQKDNLHKAMEQFQSQSTHWHQQSQQLEEECRALQQENLEFRAESAKQGRENAELAAQVEQMKLIVAVHERELPHLLNKSDDDQFYLPLRIAMNAIADSQDISAEKLRQIQAESRIAAILECRDLLTLKYTLHVAGGHLDRYAERVKAGANGDCKV